MPKLTPLLEAIPFELIEVGEVSHGDQKLMTVKGIMHRANERNGNNRIYPAPVLKREVDKLKERIDGGESVFSQADHPADGVSRISDTAALLKNVEMLPNHDVVGEAVILPTQKGKDLAAIIRAGGKVGISARGFGTTRLGECAGHKGDVVQEDYSLVTYDFVIGQSTKGAVVDSFEEQARMLAGVEETMDLSKITMEDLKAANPALIAAIEGDKVKTLTAEELTTTRPDVVETFKKKAKAATDDSAKDGEPEPDEDDMKESFSCPQCKAVTEVKFTQVQDMHADTDAEFSTDGVKRYCANCGAPLTGKSSRPVDGQTGEAELEQAKVEQALHTYAASKGLVLVPREGTVVESEVATMKQMINDQATELKQTKSDLAAIRLDSEKDKAKAHLIEKTKGEQFRGALIEQLKDCTSAKQVDEQFDTAKKRVAKILAEAQPPQGQAEAQRKEEHGSDTDAPTEIKIKGANGQIMQLTEQQYRQRVLARIPSELVG